MKHVLSALGATLILSMTAMAAKPGDLIRQQSLACSEVVQLSRQLNSGKAIPVLAKNRQQLRQTLERMHRSLDELIKSGVLMEQQDYLLSIEEGLRHMDRLADGPMTGENLSQVEDMCAFIATVDDELLRTLPSSSAMSYRAAR